MSIVVLYRISKLLYAIMDVSYLICLAVVTILRIGVSTVESSEKPADVLRKSLRASSKEKRMHGQIVDNTVEVLPTPTNSDDGYELIGSNKDDNCCLNGGICIMNSFCYCSDEYYGRFCEHRVLERSCGSLPHGKWMAAGCHLCHCFDGQLRCKVTSIKGCDGHGLVQGVEEDPEYYVDLDVKNADYDDFYTDDVDMPANDVSAPSVSSFHDVKTHTASSSTLAMATRNSVVGALLLCILGRRVGS